MWNRWNDYNASTAAGANEIYSWRPPPEPVYGQRLKKNMFCPLYSSMPLLVEALTRPTDKHEQRPVPFYLKIIDFHVLPCYNVIIAPKSTEKYSIGQNQICRRLIRGACSRKYDRVRKKRKRRIF